MQTISVPVLNRRNVGKLKRRYVKIPGLGNTAINKAYEFSDEQVIDVILCRLRGEPSLRIASRLGIRDCLVRSWFNGVTRRLCGIEAERRFRREQYLRLRS